MNILLLNKSNETMITELNMELNSYLLNTMDRQELIPR